MAATTKKATKKKTKKKATRKPIAKKKAAKRKKATTKKSSLPPVKATVVGPEHDVVIIVKGVDIKEAIEQLELTQIEVANAAGIKSAAQISRLCTDVTSRIKINGTLGKGLRKVGIALKAS